MTHVVSPICGFRLLASDFNTPADHLFSEYSTIDWFEPLTYIASAEQVQTFYPSGRIERDDEGFHWYDASGRWEIHGNTVSAVVLTHVPTQDELADNDVYYRHELMHVTGSIDGVDVSGYAHQDFAYGPDGLIYTELPIARNLQGMWMSWLHEYDDGTVGGGSFWQGRSGLDFGPGYQLRDGRTSAHSRASTRTGGSSAWMPHSAMSPTGSPSTIWVAHFTTLANSHPTPLADRLHAVGAGLNTQATCSHRISLISPRHSSGWPEVASLHPRRTMQSPR
jgi:hypothetical protein